MWNDARHKRAFSPVTQRSDASAGVSGGATDEKGKLLGGEGAQYLCHVDDPHRQGLVAQDGSVLVAFPPLQHDLQPVGVPLQKMRVLWKNEERCLMNNMEEKTFTWRFFFNSVHKQNETRASQVLENNVICCK